MSYDVSGIEVLNNDFVFKKLVPGSAFYFLSMKKYHGLCFIISVIKIDSLIVWAYMSSMNQKIHFSHIKTDPKDYIAMYSYQQNFLFL